MRFRGESAFDSVVRHRRLFIVAATFAIVSSGLAINYSSGATRDGISGMNVVSGETQKAAPGKKNSRNKRIKRLKPADPESTEVMLADRRKDAPETSTA